MKKLKIYLSGTVGQAEKNFQSWRSTCKMLRQNGYYTSLDFIDPINHFDSKIKHLKTEKDFLGLIMWQVENCDVLLLNLDYTNTPCCGSCMEVEHAYCNNIPIIAFGSKPDTWYNWVETRSTAIFDNLEDAIDYIYNSYGKLLC